MPLAPTLGSSVGRYVSKREPRSNGCRFEATEPAFPGCGGARAKGAHVRRGQSAERARVRFRSAAPHHCHEELLASCSATESACEFENAAQGNAEDAHQ